MLYLEYCKGILRGLTAKGDIDAVPLAKRSIDEYSDVKPLGAQKSGLGFFSKTC
jgi:hypothetical protein